MQSKQKWYIVHYNSNALCNRKGAVVIKLNQDDLKPIYVQISEWIEAEILNGNLGPDEKVYSQYQLAEMFTINPATAAKGLKLLADEEILYKKRGLGMFVSANAKEMIVNKRKGQILKRLVQELAVEANRLHISDEELMEMIKAAREEEKPE